MIDAFSLPDLRGKLLFTLFILIIFRFVAQIPVPGANGDAMAEVMKSNQLFGMLNLFSGGAMENFSILAMGVYPYITATIVMQLLTPVIPQLMNPTVALNICFQMRVTASDSEPVEKGWQPRLAM